MSNPTIQIHNIETNEIIQREMNAEELAQWNTDKAEAEAKAQAEALKETARQAVLAKLGLTAEEVTALLA